jgi:hypothetical protein
LTAIDADTAHNRHSLGPMLPVYPVPVHGNQEEVSGRPDFGDAVARAIMEFHSRRVLVRAITGMTILLILLADPLAQTATTEGWVDISDRAL